MKVYVLMQNCSEYRGVFSSVEKAVERIKREQKGIKITRVERVFGHFHEVYAEKTYIDWDSNETEAVEYSPYTIIEEDVDCAEW